MDRNNLSKLQNITDMLIHFDGVPGKLPIIIRQIDILGMSVEKYTNGYNRLVKARNILQEMVDKNACTEGKIMRAINHLIKAKY